jgi:hypothetical protein
MLTDVVHVPGVDRLGELDHVARAFDVDRLWLSSSADRS